MHKISKTETHTEQRIKRNGQIETITCVQEYQGDRVCYDLSIELEKEYPDFNNGNAYDMEQAKEFLFRSLIEYITTNKE